MSVSKRPNFYFKTASKLLHPMILTAVLFSWDVRFGLWPIPLPVLVCCRARGLGWINMNAFGKLTDG